MNNEIIQKLERLLRERLDHRGGGGAERSAPEAAAKSVPMEHIHHRGGGGADRTAPPERVIERIILREADPSLLLKALHEVVDWHRIHGKPDVYPSEPHTHTWSDIQDKPESYHSEPHTHTWSDIQDKPEDSSRDVRDVVSSLLETLYERGAAGDVLTRSADGPHWEPIPSAPPSPPRVVYMGGGGGPVFPCFVGSVPEGHYCIAAGDVVVNADMQIGGTLLCL